MKLYLGDSAAGAPSSIRSNIAIYPQYKRLATFQDDFVSWLELAVKYQT